MGDRLVDKRGLAKTKPMTASKNTKQAAARRLDKERDQFRGSTDLVRWIPKIKFATY